jgi:hypothetical protein
MKSALRSFAILASVAWAAGWAQADSIQPIVKTGQALYGSAQKTITSTTDVLIDTTTHVLTAVRGIKSSSITFNDGTVLTSSTTVTGTASWGAISGTLSSQADLNAKLVSIGVSTAALSASTTTLGSSVSTLNSSVSSIGTSTASLQTQINSVGTSTGSIAVQIVNLQVSTASLQTQVNTLSASTVTIAGQIVSLAASTTTLSTSTTSLQTQITAIIPVSLSTGITGTLQPSHMVSTAAFTTASQTFVGTNSFTNAAGLIVTYGVNAGSVTSPGWTPGQYLSVNASSQAVSTNLLANSNAWTGLQTFTNPLGNSNSYYFGTGSMTITGLPGNGPLRGGPSLLISTGPTNMASEVTGVLPVANGGSGSASPSLIGGTNVSISGAWPNQTVNSSGGSGGSALGTYSQSVLVSSPTGALNTNASLKVTLQGTSTAQFGIDPASGTLAGNTFNAANKLVQLSAGNQYPASNGNLITNLNAFAVSGLGNTQIPYTSAGSLTGSNNFEFDGSSMTVNGKELFVIAQGPPSTGNKFTIFNTAYAGVYYNTIGFGFGPTPTIGGSISWGASSGGTYGYPNPFFGLWDAYDNWIGGFTSATSGPSAGVVGFGIGTRYGTNNLDVAGRAAIGADYTTTGANNCGSGGNAQCGGIAPTNGLAIEGNTLIGSPSVVSTNASLEVLGQTTNPYVMWVGTAATGVPLISVSTTTTAPQVYLSSFTSSSATITAATIPALTVSTGTLSGYFSFAPRTLAQIKASTPTAVNQNYFCSDCTTSAICVSTGTAIAAYATAANKAVPCQ